MSALARRDSGAGEAAIAVSRLRKVYGAQVGLHELRRHVALA